jgi:hypothetical protein
MGTSGRIRDSYSPSTGNFKAIMAGNAMMTRGRSLDHLPLDNECRALIVLGESRNELQSQEIRADLTSPS